jgi:hypothetical protein
MVAGIGCASRSPTTEITSPEIASPSAIQVATAVRQDMELSEIRQHDDALAPGYDISGSGPTTQQGVESAPIYLLSIVSQSPPREMRLHLRLASTDGFINRSGLRWSGDHVPGVRCAARMYDRDLGGDGKVGKMAAVLHVQLPGRTDFNIVFVSYDADGKLIPYFGKRPFAEYIKRVSRPNATENQ